MIKNQSNALFFPYSRFGLSWIHSRGTGPINVFVLEQIMDFSHDFTTNPFNQPSYLPDLALGTFSYF